MTTANYFAIHPGAPLPELSSPAEVTVLSDFAPVELPWFWVVIDRCYHTQSVHDARLVFNANFPQHAIALSHLLSDDLENGLLSVDKPWVVPSLMELDDLPQFPRNALPRKVPTTRRHSL